MAGTTAGPDLDRLLRSAMPRFRAATGLDGAMVGPVTHGGSRLVVTGIHGMLTSTMLGLVATSGVGIGGRMLQLGRPAAVDDYLHSTAVSHHFDRKVAQEQLYGALAVPVRVGRDIRAVLYGAARSAQPLGDRVLDTASRVAAGLGHELAVEAEVARRLRGVAQERQRQEHRRETVDLREIHEELLAIAQATSDQTLRDRLVVLSDRIAPQVVPTVARVPLLTGRECAVLDLIALGRTTDEVAAQLSIMPTTVKTYLKNTMRKLGTRNRVETVHAARCAGLLG